MKTSYFKATGLMISYSHQISSKLSFNIATTYYKGRDFNNGELSGHGLWKNKQEYTIDAPTVIHSAHNDFLDYPQAEAVGNGFSVNIGGKWQINSQFKVSLSLNDAFSKIEWRDALTTNIDHWELYRVNSDGELDTSPMVFWQKNNYEQKLPKTQIGYLSYTDNKNIEYYLREIKTKYFSHKQFGIKKPLADNKSIFLSWHRDISAFEIRFNKPKSYISLTTDVFSSKIGRALNIEFGFSRPF